MKAPRLVLCFILADVRAFSGCRTPRPVFIYCSIESLLRSTKAPLKKDRRKISRSTTSQRNRARVAMTSAWVGLLLFYDDSCCLQVIRAVHLDAEPFSTSQWGTICSHKPPVLVIGLLSVLIRICSTAFIPALSLYPNDSCMCLSRRQCGLFLTCLLLASAKRLRCSRFNLEHLRLRQVASCGG